MNDQSPSIADRLRKACARKGVTPHALAKEAGVAYATVHQLITGQTRSLRTETLQRLAAAAGVSVGFLLGEDDATDIKAEVLAMYRTLSDEQQRMMLEMMRQMKR